jgi:hypothetical protein
MLLKLRLRFVDRPDYELAVESGEQDADPWAALRTFAGEDGRIALGDRDSCAIDEVLDVRFVGSRPAEGPGWRGKLQDEDAATAVDESYGATRGAGCPEGEGSS